MAATWKTTMSSTNFRVGRVLRWGQTITNLARSKNDRATFIEPSPSRAPDHGETARAGGHRLNHGIRLRR